MKHLALLSCFLLTFHLFAQPTAGLVAHYTFAGNPNDVSGNGNHGIIHGATLTIDQFGNLGNAYSFNGINNYIEIPVNAFLLNNYTYSVCLKTPALPPTQTFFSVGNATADQHVYITNHSPYFGFSCGSYYALTPAPPDGIWAGYLPTINTYYHVIVTRNNTSFKLYVDGILIDSLLAGSTYPIYGTGIRLATIGRRAEGTEYFNGVIDDVAVYNRALSASEIQNYTCQCSMTVSLGPDTSVCMVNSLALDAGNTGARYFWYSDNTILPNDTLQTFHPLQSGTYHVIVDNGSCMGTDTAIITVNNLNPASISSNNPNCNTDSLTLKSPYFANASYQWSGPNGFTSTLQNPVIENFNILDTGTYSLTVQFAGCPSVTTAYQLEESASTIETVSIPNVFSPNGDSKNDTYSLKELDDFEMKILNRWGQEIATLTPSNNYWNGTVQNKEVPEGIYFYILKGANCRGELITRTGDISIFRY